MNNRIVILKEIINY